LYDLYGTVTANYVQKKDSLITQTLCTGMDCFEKVFIDAEYALDLALNEYSADVNIYTEAFDEGDETVVEDDAFIIPFMRMQEDLDRLQEEPSGESGLDTLIEDKLSKEDRTEKEGTKMTMSFSLPSSSFVSQLNTKDGKYLNSIVNWSNSNVTIDLFEDLYWKTKSKFTADWGYFWSTGEIKTGFLISRDVSMGTYEKILTKAKDGDLTILANPSASISTIGKHSLYGIGLVGYPETHVVAGQIQHWDKDEGGKEEGVNVFDMARIIQ